jgi:hypothetical protein
MQLNDSVITKKPLNSNELNSFFRKRGPLSIKAFFDKNQ